MAKILVVEDNEPNRKMITRRLLWHGHDIVAVGDGAQAIALAHAARPDVILMDLSLPVLSGWEATRQIKASPATCAIPIIALTAFAMESDRARCLAAGCDGYYSKPVDFSALLRLIDTMICPSIPSSLLAAEVVAYR